MDLRLVAWARAVKARRIRRGLPDVPVLWLFTDSRRMPDPCRAIASLPAGLCGVVFRHDGVPDRPVLAAAVARVCRTRRVALTVAGDVRLAARVRAGVHLRAGRWPGLPMRGMTGNSRGLQTSSAHTRADLLRACRAGVDAVFLSPVFATRSHAGEPNLGPVCWAATAGPMRNRVLALGGISGRGVRRLPRWCAGAGAIDALSGFEGGAGGARTPMLP